MMMMMMTSIYIPNFIQIGNSFFVDGRSDGRTLGQTDVTTDGRTFPPSNGIKSIPSFRWGPSSPPQRGTDPQFSAHRHMLWPSGWMDQTTLARYEAL